LTSLGGKAKKGFMVNPSTTQTASFRPVLFALVVIALVWSTVLLYAGGFTTTIGAGMAFLDWPLSNGSINPEGWTRDRDQLAEHSHRLAGKIIGLLAILIAALFWRLERRNSLRWLAVFLLLTVIIQGVMGGLRVLLDELNTGAEHNRVAQTFAVMHALGAQSVVLLLTTLVVCSSPGWFQTLSDTLDRKAFVRLYRLGWVLLITTTLTILIGAIMRHIGAGLAIPTFPAATAEGHLLPATFSLPVTVHFAHRTLGVCLLPLIIYYGLSFYRASGNSIRLRLLALLPIVLVILQIILGWLILHTLRNAHVTTLHMLNGAALMASICACICWSYKIRLTNLSTEPVPSPTTSPLSNSADVPLQH
jgi:cytochrome c oxidase assembly protein subunit 15